MDVAQKRLDSLLVELSKRFPTLAVDAGAPEQQFLDVIDSLLHQQQQRDVEALVQSADKYADEVIRHIIQPKGESFVSEVLTKCYEADLYHKDRTLHSIIGQAMAELGETAEEVNIALGVSYKKPGVDGVVGEAVDTICAMIDLIYRHNPNITEDELAAIARAKCQKWINKVKAHKGLDAK